MRKFKGVFIESFKGVSKKLQGCFKEVSRKFQGNFKGVSRMFQGCFKRLKDISMDIKGV